MSTQAKMFQVVEEIPTEHLQTALLTPAISVADRRFQIRVRKLTPEGRATDEVRDFECELDAIGGGHCNNPHRVRGFLTNTSIQFVADLTHTHTDGGYGTLILG